MTVHTEKFIDLSSFFGPSVSQFPSLPPFAWQIPQNCLLTNAIDTLISLCSNVLFTNDNGLAVMIEMLIFDLCLTDYQEMFSYRHFFLLN